MLIQQMTFSGQRHLNNEAGDWLDGMFPSVFRNRQCSVMEYRIRCRHDTFHFFFWGISFVNLNYLRVYLTCHLHNYIAILLVLTVVCCLAAFYLVRDGFIVKCPAVFVFYV